MTMLDTTSPNPPAPVIDRNNIKWSGYFATSEQAEDHLKSKAKHIAETENKLIVSAKSDFVNRHFKGYFLYRFLVVLADKK